MLAKIVAACGAGARLQAVRFRTSATDCDDDSLKSMRQTGLAVQFTRFIGVGGVCSASTMTFLILSGMVPGDPTFHVLAGLVPVALLINTLLCWHDDTPPDREMIRFIWVSRVMLTAIAFITCSLSDAQEEILTMQLMHFPLMCACLSAAETVYGGFSTTYRKRSDWICGFFDVAPVVAIHARLGRLGSPIAQANAMVPFWFSLLIFRNLSKSVRLDLIDTRSRLESELEKSVESTLKVQKANADLVKVRQAMTRMLNGMCDCVLTLNRELSILDSTYQLASFLLPASSGKRGRGRRDMHGYNLGEFMLQKDSEILRQALVSQTMESASSQSPAAVLLARMVDDQGTTTPVELYHTPISDTEHTVALRIRCMDEVMQSNRHRDDRVPPAGIALPADDDDTDVVGPGGFHRHSCAESAAPLHTADAEFSAERLWIRFDSGCDKFSFYESSPQLQTGWLDWIEAHRRPSIENWVFREVQENTRDPSRQPLILHNIVLHTPRVMWVAREAQVKAVEVDDDEEEPFSVPAMLILSNVIGRRHEAQHVWPDDSASQQAIG